MNRKKDARCVPKSAGHSGRYTGNCNGNTGNRNSNTGAAQICSSGRAGAPLRFGAVESQDESPCGAIHKQCACHIKTNSTATSKTPA